MDYNQAFNITPNSQNAHFVKFNYIDSHKFKNNSILCYDVKKGLIVCPRSHK